MFAFEDLHFNACFRVQLRTSKHVVLYYHKNNLKRGSLQRTAAVTQHQPSAEDIPKDLVERRLKQELKSNPEPQLAQISSKSLRDNAALY